MCLLRLFAALIISDYTKNVKYFFMQNVKKVQKTRAPPLLRAQNSAIYTRPKTPRPPYRLNTYHYIHPTERKPPPPKCSTPRPTITPRIYTRRPPHKIHAIYQNKHHGEPPTPVNIRKMSHFLWRYVCGDTTSPENFSENFVRAYMRAYVYNVRALCVQRCYNECRI